mmetsp:Transcript_24715/g.57560  ORF Transcript_24715/g.57560 Transcript_24715/m.57560 type:complete len:226 (-) Transcript_24715:229-906(-)
MLRRCTPQKRYCVDCDPAAEEGEGSRVKDSTTWSASSAAFPAGGRCASSIAANVDRNVRSTQTLNSASSWTLNVCALGMPSSVVTASSNSSKKPFEIRPLTTRAQGVHRGASVCFPSEDRGPCRFARLCAGVPALFLGPLVPLFSAKRTCTPSSSRRASAARGLNTAPSIAFWRTKSTPAAWSSVLYSTAPPQILFPTSTTRNCAIALSCDSQAPARAVATARKP